MDIPEVQKRNPSNQSGTGRIEATVAAKQCFGMDVLTVCYTGSRCPRPSHSCPSPSPRCSTSRSRTCQPPLPLAETVGPLGYRGLHLSRTQQRWSAETNHLLSPHRYLHCLSLVLHLPLKQRPCRGDASRYTSSTVQRSRI